VNSKSGNFNRHQLRQRLCLARCFLVSLHCLFAENLLETDLFSRRFRQLICMLKHHGDSYGLLGAPTFPA